MVRRATLWPCERAIEVDLPQSGHEPVDMSLEVRLELLQLSEGGRVSGPRLRLRECGRGDVPYPEVQRPLRMRQNLEQGRVRRASVPGELPGRKLLERLEVASARGGDVGKPILQEVQFGDRVSSPSGSLCRGHSHKGWSVRSKRFTLPQPCRFGRHFCLRRGAWIGRAWNRRYKSCGLSLDTSCPPIAVPDSRRPPLGWPDVASTEPVEHRSASRACLSERLARSATIGTTDIVGL
jgi:hypothetical protein